MVDPGRSRSAGDCLPRATRPAIRAARAQHGAILGLTWDRVDLPGRRIDFRDPDRAAARKRRVPVSINETLAAALTEAKERATTPYTKAC
jgi:hypothetical protein